MASSSAPTEACRPRRVLVVDGDANVRSALRLVLTREPGLDVVGEAVAAEDLLPCVAASRPDLVVLDWDLPNLHEAELLPRVRALCPAVAIIAVSPRPECRAGACVEGADAFVCKNDAPAALLAAVRGLVGVRSPAATLL